MCFNRIWEKMQKHLALNYRPCLAQQLFDIVHTNVFSTYASDINSRKYKTKCALERE